MPDTTASRLGQSDCRPKQSRNKPRSGSVSVVCLRANGNRTMCAAPRLARLVREQRAPAVDMNEFAIIVAFVFTASSAAAQLATPNGQAQAPTQGSTTGSVQAPITGVFCIEEMTATFCNVVTGPNTGGYGARSGSGSSGGSTSRSSTGPGGGTSSIPPCPAEPPFNELCN
jgi:hypothetical protein